jgi:hypothetical protein
MAISTREVIIMVEPELSETAARALREWMTEMQANLAAIADKLDADGGVTDTDYGDEVTVGA